MSKTSKNKSSAMEELIRAAMASGAACFIDKARAGDVDPSGPLTDAFGDFPAEFIRIRSRLVEAAITEATR